MHSEAGTASLSLSLSLSFFLSLSLSLSISLSLSLALSLSLLLSLLVSTAPYSTVHDDSLLWNFPHTVSNTIGQVDTGFTTVTSIEESLAKMDVDVDASLDSVIGEVRA
jgi:hypothetical protein